MIKKIIREHTLSFSVADVHSFGDNVIKLNWIQWLYSNQALDISWSCIYFCRWLGWMIRIVKTSILEWDGMNNLFQTFFYVSEFGNIDYQFSFFLIIILTFILVLTNGETLHMFYEIDWNEHVSRIFRIFNDISWVECYSAILYFQKN